MLAPRTPWRPCTVARPQVASLRFVLISVRFVAGLRRSLRLQQRRHLIGQPGSQRGPLPHLQLGPLPDPPRGPHPAPQPGLQQGRRREYQCFGATADLKTFRTVGRLQSSPDDRNQQRTEHIQQPAWAVNVPFTCTFYEKEGATNQPTKGVRALCLTRARAFLPQTIGSEIRTAGSKWEKRR